MREIRFELTAEFRDRFQQALDERDDVFIRESLENVKPVDITELLYEFTPEESKYALDLLSIDIRAEIIKDLDPDTRKGFLKVYPSAEISALVDLLDSDDAADILNELPIKVSEEVLAGLDPLVRAQVIDLLRYDENVAGGLMAKELIKALGALGPKAGAAPANLLAGLRDPNAEIRQLSALALAKVPLDATAALPELLKAASDPDRSVRCYAIHAIGSLGKGAVSAIPELIAILSKDNVAEVRLAVIEELARFGPDAKAALEVLTVASRDGRPAVREAAQEALKRIQSMP